MANVALRLVAAFGLVGLSYAPALQYVPGPVGDKLAPGVAEAADLSWEDIRLPLTDIEDEVNEDGFEPLPAFGDYELDNVDNVDGADEDADDADGGDAIDGIVDCDDDDDNDCDPADNERSADPIDTDNDIFDFGTIRHPMAVSNKGTLFVGGGTRDDGLDALVYWSEDGGLTWSVAEITDSCDQAHVTSITVGIRDDDDFLLVTFTGDTDDDGDTDAADAASACNGFAWTSDMTPETITTEIQGTDGGVADNIIYLASAVDDKFDFDKGGADRDGNIYVGGLIVAGASSVFSMDADDIADANDPSMVAIASCADADADDLTGAEDTGDRTIALGGAVSDTAIGRVWVNDLATADPGNDLTYGQLLKDGCFPADDPTSVLATASSAAGFGADFGGVGFPSDYDFENSTWWVAAGEINLNNTTTTATYDEVAGGVFSNDGGNSTAWDEETEDEDECADRAFTGLAVLGPENSAKLFAAAFGSATQGLGNTVCNSTGGGSWSDAEADGDPDYEGDVNGNMGPGHSSLAIRSADDTAVDWLFRANVGSLGGVQRSKNGTSWQDTGLTNYPYVTTSVTENSATDAFVNANWDSGNNNGTCDDDDGEICFEALFRTVNYGKNAGFRRVLRGGGEGAAFTFDSPDRVSPFLTTGIIYVAVEGLDQNNILKSTDGGESWNNDADGPFVDDEETIDALDLSGTILLAGAEGDGLVAVSTDGGSTWTVLSQDFGKNIDEFDDTANASVWFVSGVTDEDKITVWMTTDNGATWKMVGDDEEASPWGTGDGGMTLSATVYDPTGAKDQILLLNVEGTAEDDVWRYNFKKASDGWVQVTDDAPAGGYDVMLVTTAAGIGDGYYVHLVTDTTCIGAGDDLDVADGDDDTCIVRTFYPLTATPDTWDELTMRSNIDIDDESDMGTCIGPSGSRCLQIIETFGGLRRVLDFSETSAFRTPPALTRPADNGNIIANNDFDIVDFSLSWTGLASAECYEVQIAEDAAFDSLVEGADEGDGDSVCENETYETDTSIFTVDGALLTIGNTYYWRTRVSMLDEPSQCAACELADGEDGLYHGPWSAVRKFNVSPPGGQITTPSPQLPLMGSATPSLGPILVSWNNPSGVAQFQIQIIPLNGDGPAINLIISDSAQVQAASYTIQPPVFGVGNYVMLPGATYTWRVRTTAVTTSVTETDPSWGPWSNVMTFLTPRPNSGSIQMVSPINGAVVTDRTPDLTWKNGDSQSFYYEIQLSSDPDFGTGARGPIASVQHQLIHGGVSSPPNTYTSPVELAPGTYYWRLRGRVQATPLGPGEPGVAWTAAQSFKVQ